MTEHTKVTKEQVQTFAVSWYRALDFHAPTEEILKLVDDKHLRMIFPEKTLLGVSDFIAWYAGGTYSDGEEAPGVINIFFDETHSVVSIDDPQIIGDIVKVKVVVAWQTSRFVPPAAKSQRISADFTQAWTLRRSNKNPYGLVIENYDAVAEPPKYAPGFSRL